MVATVREMAGKLSRNWRRLALPPGSAGVVALGLCLCLGQRPLSSSPMGETPAETTSQPLQPPPVDSVRVDDVLAGFVRHWPSAGKEERAAMARFFGLFRYRPALEVLRQEGALLGGGSAVASLQALVDLGDLEAAELFRLVLRHSNDCEAVAIAGRTLGEWGDDGSYSLFLRALLEPECSGVGNLEVVRGLFRLRHPFLDDYLVFLHEQSSSESVRLAMAALLASRPYTARRTTIDQTLRTGLTRASTELVTDPEAAGEELLVALWGLGRFSERSCREALVLGTELFDRTGGNARQIAAQALLLAGLPCIDMQARERRPWLDALVEAADHPEVTLSAARPRTSGEGLPDLPGPDQESADPQWSQWLSQLSPRLALWEGRSRDGFARTLEGSGQAWLLAGGRGQLRTGSTSSPRLPRKRFGALAEEVADWVAPEDFRSYEFAPGQPDWWPAWIDITIDDGPRPVRLATYLETLDSYGVKATFFFIGLNLVKSWRVSPDRARRQIQEMVANGHRIGYHSMSHETPWNRHLQNWSASQIADDISLFQLTLEAISDQPWAGIIGRLPGGMGRRLAHVDAGFAMAGLHAHVHWQVENPVWGPATRLPEVRALARKLVQRKEPAVILLHEYLGLHRQLDAFISEVRKEVAGRPTRPVASEPTPTGQRQ